MEETQFQKIITFYEEKLSNSNLFNKQHIWSFFYGLSALICFGIMYFNPSNTLSLIILGIVFLITLVIQIVLVYKIEKELGSFNDLKFMGKIKKCLDMMISTKGLLFINDAESIRVEKMNKLRDYLKTKKIYSEKCLKVYIEIMEKEFDNRYTNSSRLSSLTVFFVPIWAFVIQVLFNPQSFSKIVNANINDLKFAIIALFASLMLYYFIFRIFSSIMKSVILLIFPMKKYDMLDLISILRELYLECFILELEDEKRIVKGFVDEE
ncbi:hypothetical protein QRX95_00065 (plasmid) [Bacillus mycoides]|uniref:hypothetical protein n=1 Tax=Bacillus mycoides TaxID=1405 RepID=UPI00256FE22F|nr:hypothetical protein [Bacillus mycoides]WJE32360.1 hypothetical protein QRX95_00065 [Bacillus mycoides]